MFPGKHDENRGEAILPFEPLKGMPGATAAKSRPCCLASIVGIYPPDFRAVIMQHKGEKCSFEEATWASRSSWTVQKGLHDMQQFSPTIRAACSASSRLLGAFVEGQVTRQPFHPALLYRESSTGGATSQP